MNTAQTSRSRLPRVLHMLLIVGLPLAALVLMNAPRPPLPGPLAAIPEREPRAAQAAAPLWALALDCSGSMAQPPSPTDPLGFSISAAGLFIEAAAPARVVLIFFCGDGPAGVTVSDVFDLADPAERVKARRLIAERQRSRQQRNGATPTAAAIAEADRLFGRQQAAPGSTLTLITDGEPFPDADAQFARAGAIAERWKAQGWRVAGIGLGPANSPWLPRLSDLVGITGGPFASANSAAELLAIFTRQWLSLTGTPEPTIQQGVLPGSGAVVYGVDLDTTMREALIVLFRGSASTRVELVAPDGTRVTARDPRVVDWYEGDPYFVFIRLRAQAARGGAQGTLGAGRWEMRFAGSPGTLAGSAVSARGQLGLRLIAPSPGTIVAVGRPLTMAAQVVDGDRPLTARAGSVQVSLIAPSGTPHPLVLTDDGSPDNGDEAAGDGVYSARFTPTEEGAYEISASGQVEGAPLPGVTDTLRASAFPALSSLPAVRVAPARTGREVSVPLADLVAGKGRANAAEVVDDVLVLITTRDGQRVRDARLSSAEAFRDDRLVLSVPARREHITEDAATVRCGGVFDTTYLVQVAMRGTFRGQGYELPMGQALTTRVIVPVQTEITLHCRRERLVEWSRRQGEQALTWLRARHRMLQVMAIAPLAALTCWWLVRRARHAPSPAGSLESGQPGRRYFLSDLETHTPPWRRTLLLAPMWAGGRALDPALRGVELGVSERDGALVRWARSCGLQRAQLNGAPLPRAPLPGDLAPLTAITVLVMAVFIVLMRAAVWSALPLHPALAGTLALMAALLAASRLPVAPGSFGWRELAEGAVLVSDNRGFACRAAESGPIVAPPPPALNTDLRGSGRAGTGDGGRGSAAGGGLSPGFSAPRPGVGGSPTGPRPGIGGRGVAPPHPAPGGRRPGADGSGARPTPGGPRPGAGATIKRPPAPLPGDAPRPPRPGPR